MDVEPTHHAKEADMPGEQPPPPPTAAALLAEARRAWQLKLWAESELARLRRYSHLSKPMRRDQSRHYSSLREAESTLSRILAGRPEGESDAQAPGDTPAGAVAPTP